MNIHIYAYVLTNKTGGGGFPNMFLILYCIYCSLNIFWRTKHLIIFLLCDILADLITMKMITQKNDFKKKKIKLKTHWQNFFSNILNAHTLWLRHSVCLLPLSNFSMICFLYLFAGLILITHISGLFLSLLRMVLSGVLSLNCTKLSHFQLVNYIFFLQFQSSPCAIWRSWSLVCVVFIFIIYLQMYQSYMLLYYFSVILYYEFSISMWTSWYSKNKYFVYLFLFSYCVLYGN